MKKNKLLLFAAAFLPAMVCWGNESLASNKPDYSHEQILQLWKDNKKSAAMREIDEWKTADKKAPGPWVAEANIAFEQKKYKKCLSLGEKALDLSPQFAPAYYWRGRAYEALSNWMDSANEYRAAILADPTFSEARVSLDQLSPHLSGPSTDARTSADGPKP